MPMTRTHTPKKEKQQKRKRKAFLTFLTNLTKPNVTNPSGLVKNSAFGTIL